MSIMLGATRIYRRYLGNNRLNKIMLGAIEVFPNIAPVTEFNPSDWFANGEKGLFYNFNDPSSLCTFALSGGQVGGFGAGTQGFPPVMPATPFGWVLDKKRPPGPQLIQNANYAIMPVAWTVTQASYVVNNGVITLTNTAAARGMIVQSFPTVVGKKYLIKLGVLNDGTGGTVGQNVNLRVGAANNYAGANLVNVHSPGSEGYATFVATSTTSWLFLAIFGTAIGATASFGTMEIGEWDGNQAYQLTGTRRPQFNTVGSAMGAIFDGVDDELIETTLDMSGWTSWTIIAQCNNTRAAASSCGLLGNYGGTPPKGLTARSSPATRLSVLVGTGTTFSGFDSAVVPTTVNLAVSMFKHASGISYVSQNDGAVESRAQAYMPQTTLGFTLGRSPHDANTGWTGAVVSIVAINRALTPAEITQYYNWCLTNGSPQP